MNRCTIVFLLAVMLAASSAQAQYSKPSITITPDGCQHAFVRVYDGLKADQGLSEVYLMNDPDGVITPDKYVSTNVAIDGREPTDFYGNTADSFNVKVIDPTQPAVLIIYAVNHTGRSSVQEWHFVPIGLAVTGNGMFVNDSIGTTACQDFTITNNDTTILFNGLSQPRHATFTISNITPQPGTMVKKGDQIKFQVCFTAKTLDTVYDQVNANVSCFSIPVSLTGIGRSPIMSAASVTFNGVDLGDTSCKSLRIWNHGNAPLWIADTNVDRNSEFVVSGQFPMRIDPNTFEDIQVCFEPKGKYGQRQLMINWVNNQPPEYPGGYYSYLVGIASPPGLHWDRTSALYDPQHDTTMEFNELTFTVTNTSKTPKTLDSIAIRGPQASTFVPLHSFAFPRTLAADESIVMKIQWQPIQPPPMTQRATAFLFSGGIAGDSLVLTGLYPDFNIVNNSTRTDFTIYPNPLGGNLLHVMLPEASQATLEVLNLVGQPVVARQLDAGESEIALPDLTKGTYFVRMTQNGVMQTKRLMIQR